jgi:MFS family permease
MSFASAPRGSSEPHRTPEARWRDVYLVAGARGISVCGDFLAATSLALALQMAGAGGLAVSGLLLAATLPLVVLAPLAGRLADRVDSRTLLIIAGLGQAAVCSALAFVRQPALVMVLVALLAAGLAVTQPTLAALLPDMVPRAHLARASAITQTAGSVGMLVAPALAGLLVGQFGVRLPLLLDAASYLAIVAAGVLLRTRRGGRPRRVAADGSAPRPATRWRLTADPLLRALIVSLAAVLLAVGAINVVAIFFIRETLDASTTVYGVVEAAWTAGILGGSWLFTLAARWVRDDGGLVAGVLAQLGGCAAVIALAAAAGAPGWLVPLWFVGGVLNGGTNVFDNLLMASRVPPAERGRAFAALGAAANGAAMAGFLAGGVLLGYVPPRPLVAGLGLAGVAVVLALAVPVVRAVRRERTAVARGGPPAWYATLPDLAGPVAAVAGYRKES